MDKHCRIITDVGSLRAILPEMRAASALALDTEFVWERTYYARLGLVQVGMPDGQCYLLDAVKISDLTPLGEVLCDDSVTKVLHDAPQDLMILHRATGAAARNLFDTRLAAGFAGLSSELSLQNLLLEFLGVHIPKGHTRADWTLRPLEQHLLDYAIDDVLYLPELAARLRVKAVELGVEHWVNEEMVALECSPACRQPLPEDQYLRVKGVGSLSSEGVAVLRELAAWREQRAITIDRPRRQVAEDRDLITIAHALPANEQALRSCKKLSRGLLRKYTESLVSAVKRGLDLPMGERPIAPLRADVRKIGRARVDGLFHSIGLRARERQIDPQLVTNKSAVVRLLSEWPHAQPEDHRLMRGWRSELLGDTLDVVTQSHEPYPSGLSMPDR